jgi:hypothetical protein
LNVCDHRLFVSHRPRGDVALFGRLNQGCRDRVNGVAELFEDRKMSALRVGEVADRSFVNHPVRFVLASLALELHSSKANKRVLLEELKRARSAAAPTPRGEATLVQRLTDSRDKLNLLAEMMHVAHEPSGLSRSGS